jgi:hypothetical protein
LGVDVDLGLELGEWLGVEVSDELVLAPRASLGIHISRGRSLHILIV